MVAGHSTGGPGTQPGPAVSGWARSLNCSAVKATSCDTTSLAELETNTAGPPGLGTATTEAAATPVGRANPAVRVIIASVKRIARTYGGARARATRPSARSHTPGALEW